MNRGSHTLFETRSGRVLELLQSGLAISDAAREVGVEASTVKGWLRRGRRDPASKYGPFATAFDVAQAARRLPPIGERPVDAAELLLIVSRAARDGSAPAMRLAWEMLRVDQDSGDENPLAELDDLAQRRMRGAA